MTTRYAGPIIDAHHHLWDLALDRHPWITSESSAIRALGDIGYLRRNYLVDDFLADIGPQNVVGSVYIEAAWDRTRSPLEEVEWLEGVAKPRRIAARCIGWAPLRTPDVEATLAALAQHDAVVGIRETVRWHPDPAKRWTEAGLLDDPAWRNGFALLRRHGLMLELLMNPYQAEDVARLAAATPEQVFIVNHCGTPVDRDAEGLARWRDGLQLMGRQPNIAIKISNFGAYATDRSAAALRRTIMTCVDAFGPRRSMFGTDTPVARRNMSYQRSCESFKDAVQDLAADEQRNLFHDTAARYYRFAAP